MFGSTLVNFMYSAFTVIDLLRMIILHPDGATRLLKHMDNKSGTLSRNIPFVPLLFMIIVVLDLVLQGLTRATLDNIICARML